MQPAFENFSYHFIIKFVVTGSLSNFLLNSFKQSSQISVNETQVHKYFFWLSHHLTSVLYFSGESLKHFSHIQMKNLFHLPFIMF